MISKHDVHSSSPKKTRFTVCCLHPSSLSFSCVRSRLVGVSTAVTNYHRLRLIFCRSWSKSITQVHKGLLMALLRLPHGQGVRGEYQVLCLTPAFRKWNTINCTASGDFGIDCRESNLTIGADRALYALESVITAGRTE